MSPSTTTGHPPRPMSKRRKAGWAAAALIGLLLTTGVAAYLLLGVDTWYIPGEAMSPTVAQGSRVATYTLGETERGDLVLFDLTTLDVDVPVKHAISRVIALGGETISLENEAVQIDGVLLDEPYLPVGTPTFHMHERPTEFHLPDGYVFVMGDNRTRSSDSRFYGPIPEDLIQANSLWVLWSND